MTNQTNPPCPVYSIEKHGSGFVIYAGRDNEHHGLNLGYIQEPDKRIAQVIEAANIGHACRELGIETVEQLKTRLAHDPWVGINWITANIAPVERVISRGVYESILLHITPKRGEPYVSIGRFINGEFIPDGHSGDWHKYVTHWASINTIAAQRGEVEG